MSITITGASDDLIEIEGDIREEFAAATYGNANDLLAFSDGTVLRIEYARNGVWRITPVVPGAATLAITPAPENDDDKYSDKAVLDGDVRWVVHGKAMAS